jgi:hypothetical protein
LQFQTVLSVAVGGWIAFVLMVLSMCRAAKRSDEAMDVTMAAGHGSEMAHAPPAERPLRGLGLDHAATLLGVSPRTLLAWQARYGFPTSNRSEPRYSQSEVLALRDSLAHGLSIASAVNRARQQTKRRRGPSTTAPFGHRDGGLAS